LERRDFPRAFVGSAPGTAGGTAGAASGGISGGLIGVQIGAWGGPVAWITLPAGGLVEAGVGGVGGYFVGRCLAQRLVDTWYGPMDKEVGGGVGRLAHPGYKRLKGIRIPLI
jgi:hypothetical protein